MRTFVSAKIHDIAVTAKSVRYFGSVTICRELMARAGIRPYEQVHVVNLNNGQRWVTYALPGDERGVFSLNGGGARLGELGDRCVVLTYQAGDEFTGTTVVFCDERNEVRDVMAYR
jgi:aspartate 1-decarboxylase